MIAEYKNSTQPANCTNAAIHEFPTIAIGRPPRYDYVAFASVVSIYVFQAMAILSNTFFVPAMERLCYKLHITYDIAGATVMTVVTTSPQLFVHIISTFLTKNNLGVGTILGSAIFNTLAVTAICGIFTTVTIFLDWWPLTRDTIWYAISICDLFYCLLDGIISWQESLVMVILYGFNLANLIWDRSIQKHCRTAENPCLPCFVVSGDIPDFVGTLKDDPNAGSEKEVKRLTIFPSEDSRLGKLLWITSWPINILLCITIPDCRRKGMRDCYIIALVMSSVWMCILSYLASWMITIIGYNLFIPDSVLGLTFIAAGSSIAEVIGSLIVTRKGYGSMSFCNTISCNTFTILICLGVPWLIKAAFFLNDGEKGVIINSTGLTFVTGSMLATNFMLYFCLMFMHFKSGKAVGWTSLAAYIVYITIASMVEMNIFGMMNLPPCEFI